MTSTEKCPRCGGQLHSNRYNENKACFQCGYIQKLPTTIPERPPKPKPITKKPPNWGKPGAHVNKSVPTPDEVVMIDKRGVKYRVKSGRKRTGEWRNCIDCGKPIFVRSHRNGPTQGKRCAPCNRKVYLPPRKVRQLQPLPETNKLMQDISKEEFYTALKKACAKGSKAKVEIRR